MTKSELIEAKKYFDEHIKDNLHTSDCCKILRIKKEILGDVNFVSPKVSVELFYQFLLKKYK